MKIYDTTEEMLSSYEDGEFSLEKWKCYMAASIPGAKDLCLNDMNECLNSGFTWEKDFLPVLNSVHGNPDKLREAVGSFHRVTDELDEKIRKRFGKTVDADIVLYLGLCNGAGWVTEVEGRTTVLLGIEKILELNWCDTDSMNALIVHELGHVYHAQYGAYCNETETMEEHFLWQLFKEGVAMVFEQEVIGDPEYFHQDKAGWKAWCDDRFESIRESFSKNIHTMTRENQNYFGDWVSYEGYSDVGYYLGTRFIRHLLETEDFDEIILYNIEKARERFTKWKMMK